MLKDISIFDRNLLITSICLFIYFSFLLFINYMNINTQLIQIIAELITIPSLMLSCIIPCLSIYKIFNKTSSNYTATYTTLVISLCSITLLLIATFCFE